MSQENLEFVRSIYADWERGDFASAEWAHPDIEFAVGDSFEAGRVTGLVRMAEAWHDWLSAWEQYRVEVDGGKASGIADVLDYWCVKTLEAVALSE
jgi:hypothetical protein